MRLATMTVDRIAPATSRHALLTYGVVMMLAAAADLLTKQIAVASLGSDTVIQLFDRMSLMVVFNTGGAGGVMVGPYTWQLNVLVTVAALGLITMVAPSLVAIDSRARLALGLVAGGALGNLASMLFGPEGVADFLGLRLAGDTMIVMNVADLELWAGALLLLPVVLTLLRAIRAERRVALNA